MKKVVVYKMSRPEWGGLLGSLDGKYDVTEAKEKYLTISNNNEKCGKVAFPERECDDVKVSVTSSALEEHLDSFFYHTKKYKRMFFSEEEGYAPVKIELPSSVYP